MSDAKLAELEARIQELEDVREITDAARKFNWECCGGFNGVQAGRMEALDNLADDATIEVKGLHNLLFLGGIIRPVLLLEAR